MSVAPRGRHAADPRAGRGRVQGVGFRPYVFRLATELGLGGFVLNDERGVLVEVEGDAARARPLPRAARRARRRRWRVVERVGVDAVAAAGADAASRSSTSSAQRRAGRARLAGQRDLRRLPRRAVRPRATGASGTRSSTARTAGRASRSCAASPTTGRSRRWPASRCAPRCRSEYDDPRDRRFHAQPNACPACGPAARLVDRTGARRRCAVRATTSRPRPARCATG